MSAILLRLPLHPYRWLWLLALQQLLLLVAVFLGPPLFWGLALLAALWVLHARYSPPERHLWLHPEDRSVIVGARRVSLAEASWVCVSLVPLGRLDIYDRSGQRLLTLRGLSLPHARWAARQLSEHFGLSLESTEDTARELHSAPLADGFLEKVLEVPVERDLVLHIGMVVVMFAAWARAGEGAVPLLLAGALSSLLVAALALKNGKRKQRVRFTADRVESVTRDLLGRSHTTVLRASELLSAPVVPGLGASPTVILADRQGQRIELTGIAREDLLAVSACVEQMRSAVEAIPEPAPEPEALRRLRTARVLER